MLRLGLSAALLICALAASAGPAAAQAPIVYAAATEPRVQSASLAGGGEHSYGYGAPQRSRDGAVIDIRRTADEAPVPDAAPAVTPETPSTTAPAEAPGERPQWLEQERVGPPYRANGRWYVPTPEPGYEETGTASWYGPQFHGQRTANGEVFDQAALTAAHPTLPLNSLVQVTNLENGREVIVRVTDRGPFAHERLIDLSQGAAEVLGFVRQGHTTVHVRYLGPAPRRYDAAAPPAPPATSETMPTAAPLSAPSTPPSVQGPISLAPPSTGDQLAGGPVAPAPAAAPAAPLGAYVIQVGAFSDLANAQRVRSAVATAGPVSIDVLRAPGGELFRVRVGPFGTQADAETARRTLADLGYGESIVAAR